MPRCGVRRQAARVGPGRPGHPDGVDHGSAGAGAGWLVPHSPQSVGLVRRQVTADLRAAGTGAEVVDDVALVVSELVGNAVRHGRGLPGGGLRAHWDVARGVVRLEVEDGGSGPTEVGPRPASGTAESGRGLALVGLLATRWGSAATPCGTAVWAELPSVPVSPSASGPAGPPVAGPSASGPSASGPSVPAGPRARRA